MSKFISLCWRDLWRNTRRTVLTGLVMVFAMVVMILFIGLGDGSHAAMIRGATDSYLGHLQVQERGFADEPGLEHVMTPDDVLVAGKVLSVADGIQAWAPRVETGGLLTRKVPDPLDEDDPSAYREMASEGVFVIGVDPRRENLVSTLHTSLVADDPKARCLRGCGASLAEIYVKDEGICEPACEAADKGYEGEECRAACSTVCKDRCPEDDELCEEQDCLERCEGYCAPASFLAERDPYANEPYLGQMVLGAGLAKVLDIGVGDRVALTSGTAMGRPYASLYQVVGLVKTGSLQINRTFALTHYEKLSDGLEIPGGATSLVASVKDLDAAGDIAGEVDEVLEQDHLKALSWAELSPELDIYVKIDQGSLLVMLILMIGVVGVILANVVTMSVMERTREYGVRLALGEPPARISWGLVTETCLLALTSGVIGGIIGESLNYYFQIHGIDFGMGDMEVAGVVISTVMNTQMTLYGFLFSVGTIFFFAVLGSVYPAWRIRRIRPVDAIRFV